MKTIKNITLLLVLLGLGACASMTEKFDAPRAKNVRKVAILSLELAQQFPTDNAGISAFSSVKKGVRPSDEPEIKNLAKKIYGLSQDKIAKASGWSVVPMDKVASSPSYSKIYQENMTGARLQSFTSGNQEVVFADGILDNIHFRKLSHEQKVELAKSLGADAYAEVTVFQSLQEDGFMGMSLGAVSGNTTYTVTSRANIMVFDFKSDENIWRLQNVDGSPSRNSKALKDSKRLERLAILSEESASSALDKLVSRFPKQ